MRNRKIVRNTVRQAVMQNASNLKQLYVMLYDIALYPDLIPPQYKHIFENQLKHITKSSKPKNHNIQLSRQNARRQCTNYTCNRSVKNFLKDISVRKSREERDSIESRLNSRYIKLTKEISSDSQSDEVFQPKFVRRKWQSIIDSDDESSNVKSDYTSNKISYIPKNTVLENTKTQHIWESTVSKESRFNISPGTLNSNKLDLSYGLTIPSVEKEISTKKSFQNITASKVLKNSYSDILLSTFNNKVNGKEDQHDIKTTLNNNSITSAVDLKSTAIVPETVTISHVTENNLLKTCDENKSLIIQQTLPKITRDAVLPKGTVRLVRLNRACINAWKNISKNSSLEENEYNNRNKNVKQIIDKDILRKEENNVSSIEIKSVNTSKTSKCVIQKNNIQNSNTLIHNDGLYNKVLNHKNPNSLTITKNDIHNNININDASIEAITDTNCTIYHQIQSRKRTAEEKNTDVNTCAKRIKLNRNFQQNNIKSYIEPLDRQVNDFLNTPNTTTKDAECNEIDLRKILDRKRIKKTYKSEMIDDETVNNTVSMEVNNKNNIIDVTNIVENGEIYEKVSQKEASTFNKDVYEKQNNAQIGSLHSNDLSDLSDDLHDISKETDNQININTDEDTNMQKKRIDGVSDNNNCDNEDDDDCISLFANETFDISCCEDMFPDKQEKLTKSLQSDTPYIMSTDSFNKYLKQNTNEFNKEYERCMKNNIKKSQYRNSTEIVQNSTKNKTEEIKVIENSLPKTCNETKLLTVRQTLPKITQDVLLPKETVFNKQLEQTAHTASLSASSTNLTSFAVPKTPNFASRRTYFYGFCFNILTRSTCELNSCIFRHNFQDFMKKFHFQNTYQIMDIIYFAKTKKFYFFCEELYRISLQKLNVDQILTVYKMFYDICKLPKDITSDIIKELLRRQIPLKNIVDYILASINSSSIITNVINNYEIFQCVKQFMKPGECWYIAKNMVSTLTPDKYIIENILYDSICHGKLSDIQDINDTLISKLHPDIISQLNERFMTRFKTLLIEKTAKDICTTKLIQDFGESSIGMDTIASPDSKQMESPKSFNNTVINSSQTSKIEKHGEEKNIINGKPYILHPIDNLPEAQSVYRNHKHLWKFYIDLERVKKGLEHQDYDYVINTLEEYAGKQDNFFVRSCCNMLRTEIKRTDHHLANIIQRTVQTGIFTVLRRILFDIGIDILVALMDVEAWRLAFHFVESLKICDLPSSAEFTMLSAEIYLANKRTLEAFNLFKNKNIICTSRAKWHVMSTVHDEHIRNKLMYILLDSLCNGLIEHAFFLFTFLLKDQYSQFYPIDLSRYVNKLVILLLSKNETALIIEMGNLILKYNFPLNTKTCRALISTLIHTDEKLAIQLYHYAEATGLYPIIELWPVTHIIINSDLTEEEVYLVILQLLEKLKMNFGHTIEFIKSQFTVYVILEVKSTKQFYRAEQQIHFNSQTIANIKALVRNVLKKRFDPPMLLITHAKEKICKLQQKSLINYLKSEHCN